MDTTDKEKRCQLRLDYEERREELMEILSQLEEEDDGREREEMLAKNLECMTKLQEKFREVQGSDRLTFDG